MSTVAAWPGTAIPWVYLRSWVREVEEARARHAALPGDAEPEALVRAIAAMGFRWGDGNGT